MLNRDNIENTEEYKEAMLEITPILEKEFENKYGMGICHCYWRRKKELLKNYDIDWKAPSEMNPDVIFDSLEVIFMEKVLNELIAAGYDYGVAIATKAEIEAGAACGQLSLVLETE